jgi:hypothetical protein
MAFKDRDPNDPKWGKRIPLAVTQHLPNWAHLIRDRGVWGKWEKVVKKRVAHGFRSKATQCPECFAIMSL